jgi:hypothetical protein|tara:strand:- start:392 stop:742 length:351 start_codon:yes stop_codon:yes gene_type:complete
MNNLPLTFDTQFEIPEGLSKLGLRTAKAIRAFAKKRGLNTGGCKTFYSPQEWSERGEKYGEGSELIVVYDGGDLAQFFNYDYEEYDQIDRMHKALEQKGVFSECLYSWCSGVYDNR